MEEIRVPPVCPFLLGTSHKTTCMTHGCVMWDTTHSCTIKASAGYLARILTDLAEIKSMLKYGHAKVQHVHWWTRLWWMYKRRKTRLRVEEE